MAQYACAVRDLGVIPIKTVKGVAEVVLLIRGKQGRGIQLGGVC